MDAYDTLNPSPSRARARRGVGLVDEFSTGRQALDVAWMPHRRASLNFLAGSA
jgi:hypothetical protein